MPDKKTPAAKGEEDFFAALYNQRPKTPKSPSAQPLPTVQHGYAYKTKSSPPPSTTKQRKRLKAPSKRQVRAPAAIRGGYVDTWHNQATHNGLADASSNPHIKLKTAQEKCETSWATRLLDLQDNPNYTRSRMASEAGAASAAPSALRLQRFTASRDAQVERSRNVSSIVADGQVLELPATRRDRMIAGSQTARSNDKAEPTLLYKGPVVAHRVQTSLELPGECMFNLKPLMGPPQLY
jgi:hypothetical protein